MADDPKVPFLRQQQAFHHGFQAVTAPGFQEGDFFDPRDLLLVKYEMLRKVRIDGCAVAEAARLFGLSRSVYYETWHAWQAGGLVGLLPDRPGPRGPHKLTNSVMTFLETLLVEDGRVEAAAWAERLRRDYGVLLHPRSIEKALKRRQKKG